MSCRMKLEGKEKATATAKALQMSLAYQFVTPLTSMTIRGMTDEDGLEPIIDKPPEGRGAAKGEAAGLRRLLRAKNFLGFDSLPFLSLPDSLPLGEFFNHVGFQEGLLGSGKQLVPQPPGAYPPAPHPPAFHHKPAVAPCMPGEPLCSLLHPGLHVSLCLPSGQGGGAQGGLRAQACLAFGPRMPLGNEACTFQVGR